MLRASPFPVPEMVPQGQTQLLIKNILFFKKYSIQPSRPAMTPCPSPK